MPTCVSFLALTLGVTATCYSVRCQEAPIGEPDPLRSSAGAVIEDAEQWRTIRRPEVLELFRSHVYGRAPAGRPLATESREEDLALRGRAVRKQWSLRYGDGPDDQIHVLAFLPRAASRDAAGSPQPREAPAPVFLALNFQGNQTVHPDPGIRLASCWVRNNQRLGVTKHRATEQTRGSQARRWPVELMISRGYGLVTACYGDIDPDFDDGFENGVHGAVDGADRERAPDAWGAIGAWAWGLSRILDSLAADPDVDENRVAVLGHSRLGKTALWAGAQDERFWMVVSNNSGCGGAAYSRRRRGETVAVINKNFPHWFCSRFHGYADRESSLPVDQHLLIALCAPRPVYVASAAKDAWADPAGEFFSARSADPVYRLLCDDGLPAEELPAVDAPAHGRIGYHLRSGKHDLLRADWLHYMDFADRHLLR